MMQIVELQGVLGYGLDWSGGVWSRHLGRRAPGPGPHLTDTWSPIILRPDSQGKYMLVDLHQGRYGTSSTCTVHSLIAECFIGKRPLGYEINHKDGNKKNNCVDNLEYVTSKENKRHARETGLIKPRTIGTYTKLDWPTVRVIRELYSTGNHTFQTLADIYRVSNSCIGAIIAGASWKDPLCQY